MSLYSFNEIKNTEETDEVFDLDRCIKNIESSSFQPKDRLANWSCTFDEKYIEKFGKYDGYRPNETITLLEFNNALETDAKFKKYFIDYLNERVEKQQYEMSNFLENVEKEDNKLFIDEITPETLSEPIKITKSQIVERKAFIELNISDEEKINVYAKYLMYNDKSPDEIGW